MTKLAMQSVKVVVTMLQNLTACLENGFRGAEFIGLKKDYIKFVQKKKKKLSKTKYYKELISGQTHDCQIPYRVAGAKCPSDANSLSDCDVVDFLKG